ncbi:hypothetical protein [Arthrobacter sp. NPDC056727]|uniref:hypothetical protein n=1 Tax=Arthrobacter sp. NPDC056727 TaxID=3345927 RepID=UPI00366E276A
MPRLRSAAWLALLLPALLPATGCATVCPAIAWINSLTMVLDGDTRVVARVQLCTKTVCSEATDGLQRRPVLPTATATPTGANGLGLPLGLGSPERGIIVERTGTDTWRFGFDMDAPGAVTVRALDSAGKILAERKVSLEWKRIGGTAECGGPATAAPVTLTVTA